MELTMGPFILKIYIILGIDYLFLFKKLLHVFIF